MNKLKIFKLRKPTRVVSMLSIGCFSGVTVLSSCAETIDFKTYVLPTVKMFANTENKQYIINDDTSISFNLESIPSGVTPEYPVSGARRQLIREIFQNIAGEYYTKLLQTNHALASHPNLKIKIENAAHEISFEFLSSDHLDSLDQITSDKYPEAYQININDKIQVRAFNEYGWLQAARTLLQLQLTNDKGIPYGQISDWPKIQQRGIEIDFSGRGYPLSFVSTLVKTLAWNKLNTVALRFASGGMRLDCNKIDEAPSNWQGTGTWFQINWHDYDTVFPDEPTYFNLNQNYRDDSPTWKWDSEFSEFSNLLNLAYKEGVKIIPEVNIFTHAWFLADLTIPINNQGQYVDDGKGISDPNLREKDFAIWDDRSDDEYPLGKRIPDTLDLRGGKAGSKAAIDMCKKFLKYFAQRFTSIGNYYKHALLSFGIGGDEYLETLDGSWAGSPNVWNSQSKIDIVKSIYTFNKEMSNTLNENGIQKILQWSDAFLKKYNDWPEATTEDWNQVLTNKDYVGIKHWWSKYGNAPINDFVKPIETTLKVGGGINKVINYNSDLLYFSDDDSNTSTVPTAQQILDNFQPGLFAGNAGNYLDNNGLYNDEYPDWLTGAMMSVWWDYAPHVSTLIGGPLKAFAQKCWNGTQNQISLDKFDDLTKKIGSAPLIDWD